MFSFRFSFVLTKRKNYLDLMYYEKTSLSFKKSLKVAGDLHKKAEQLFSSLERCTSLTRKPNRVSSVSMGAFALKSTSSFQWFLDSGCSRHMTGDLSCFVNSSDFEGGTITFGDVSCCYLSKNGTIKLPGIPEIHDVVYIKGMTVNLLSVSQICDKGHTVVFNADGCDIIYKTGKVISRELVVKIIVIS